MVSHLVRETISALRSGNPAWIESAVGYAVGLFEVAAGHPTPAEPAASDDPATPDELTALRDALTDVANNAPAPGLAGSALFALGKRYDPALVNFFVRWLADRRTEDPAAAYQAMIALDNLGVSVFDEPGPWGVDDTARNLRMADRFLRRVGANSAAGRE